MQTENKKLYNYTQLITEHFEHLITTCRTSTRQKKFHKKKRIKRNYCLNNLNLQ